LSIPYPAKTLLYPREKGDERRVIREGVCRISGGLQKMIGLRSDEEKVLKNWATNVSTD
jgi:hypothetical protein